MAQSLKECWESLLFSLCVCVSSCDEPSQWMPQRKDNCLIIYHYFLLLLLSFFLVHLTQHVKYRHQQAHTKASKYDNSVVEWVAAISMCNKFPPIYYYYCSTLRFTESEQSKNNVRKFSPQLAGTAVVDAVQQLTNATYVRLVAWWMNNFW